jgi:hypothetical protein
MNPNMTVYYAANIENRRMLERNASRKGSAELAAVENSAPKSTFAASLKRVMVATFERPRQIVRGVTFIDTRASA